MGYASRFNDEPKEDPAGLAGSPNSRDGKGILELVKHQAEPEDVEFPEPSIRVGMYQHLSVGMIKYVTSKKFNDGDYQHILVEVTEKCRTRTGEVYDAKYNLWLSVDGGFSITSSMLHRHCRFGFRIYCLRNKDLSGVYTTHLLLKHFELIDEVDVEKSAMAISDSIQLT